MNVKNAFFHRDLEEKVYMSIPLGHPNETKPNLVCKLKMHCMGSSNHQELGMSNLAQFS